MLKAKCINTQQLSPGTDSIPLLQPHPDSQRDTRQPDPSLSSGPAGGNSFPRAHRAHPLTWKPHAGAAQSRPCAAGSVHAHPDALFPGLPRRARTERSVTLQTAAWSMASKPPSGASRFRDTLCFRTSSLKLSTLSVRGSRWRNPKEGTQFGNNL